MRWMTRQQIIDKYNSVELADDIIRQKRENHPEMIKAHPDLPDREERSCKGCL